MDRRTILKQMGMTAVAVNMPIMLHGFAEDDVEEVLPYGLISQMKVAAGKRDALVEILAIGTRDMPGNISYIISEDNEDENAIWITEYWKSKEAHAATLQLPAVEDVIGKGRAFIEGFGHRFEVTPKAGK